MNARDVLDLAEFLLQTANTPQQVKPLPAAHCRSAVSRGYYALYLRAVAFLGQIGFEPDPGNQGSVHFDLATCLSHAGSTSKVVAVREVANRWNTLSAARKDADYDLSNKSTEDAKQVARWLLQVQTCFTQLDALTGAELGQLASAVDSFIKGRKGACAFRRKPPKK